MQNIISLADPYIKSLPSLLLKERTDLNAYAFSRNNIENLLDSTSSWNAVIASLINQGNPASQEAFIDVIEHRFNTKVTTEKQILELTGINIDWESKKLISFLKRCINTSKENKLYDTVYGSLKNGAKYNELLQLNPVDFGVSNSWENFFGTKTDINDLIKMAIYYVFSFDEKFYSESELKTLAESIEAPLAIILEAKIYFKTPVTIKI
jgi:hypothetical protein